MFKNNNHKQNLKQQQKLKQKEDDTTITSSMRWEIIMDSKYVEDTCDHGHEHCSHTVYNWTRYSYCTVPMIIVDQETYLKH